MSRPVEDVVSPVWRLDKRIPISLILAIVLQTSGGVWWARGVSSAIEYTSLTQVKLEARIERMERDYDDVRARVIRMEEKLVLQTETIIEQGKTLKETLEKLVLKEAKTP